MKRLIALLGIVFVIALLPAPGQAARVERLAGPGSSTAVATGVLVTSKSALTPLLLQTIGSLVGRKIVGTSAVGDSVVALQFDKTIPASSFGLVTRLLTGLGPITWIEPDLRATTDAVPNDTYFARQSNLWSGAAPSGAPTGQEDGSAGQDYSIQAPALWQSTLGSKSVVVAVVDGGIVSHTDLPKTVAGYDMIADKRISRDGDGRDSSAADPGNWSDGTYCPAYSSVWHGSHVAGIIAAKHNNGAGITGIAPGVTIQPVRVMGQCGGSMSDIVAGIRWASGGQVDGVPVNKTPAKVINVSLTSSYPSCPVAYQDAIDEARQRGSLVVVSAGNQHAYVSSRTPANCRGVISVGASTPEGRRATYTNAGPTLGLMAPGGQVGEGEGIWSTIDAGTKGPSKSAYAQYSGTSMAAPAVSAAAALIHSLGTFTPDQVEQVLKASTTTPPTYNANYDCGTLCGAGILNLANIPAPIGTSTLTGATSVGSVLTVSPARWNGSPDGVTVQWTRAGKTIDGATGLSYTVTPDDLGRTLTARPIAHKQGFPDVVGLSVAKPIPKAASTMSLQLSALTAKRKSTRLIARISLTVPQGLTPSGTVSIHVGSKRVATIDLKAETREVSLPVFSETGTFSLKAVYVGDDKLLPSTSPIVKVKVTS